MISDATAYETAKSAIGARQATLATKALEAVTGGDWAKAAALGAEARDLTGTARLFDLAIGQLIRTANEAFEQEREQFRAQRQAHV